MYKSLLATKIFHDPTYQHSPCKINSKKNNFFMFSIALLSFAKTNCYYFAESSGSPSASSSSAIFSMPSGPSKPSSI